MKKITTILYSILLITGIGTLEAQTLPSGDLFRGWSKPLTYDKMIVPHGLEVSDHKTTHLIFPSSIRYVDLGSNNLIAGKAEGAENVLRVKASVANFATETNLTVICEDGSFYAFNVKYADEPERLNIEVNGFLSQEGSLSVPNKPNKQSVYFKELGDESPRFVDLLMSTIYRNNRTKIHHIGSQKMGIKFLLKGLYAYKGLLFFHTELYNRSQIPFEVDFMTFRVVDQKMLKKTAIQEKQVRPVRVYHPIALIKGYSKERSVFCLQKITLPDDKILVVSVFEKNGSRQQSFELKNSDLIAADNIKKLKLKWN